MFGSDWPVCLVAAEYGAMKDVVAGYVSKLSKNEQSKIWAENAVKFYSLD